MHDQTSKQRSQGRLVIMQMNNTCYIMNDLQQNFNGKAKEFMIQLVLSAGFLYDWYLYSFYVLELFLERSTFFPCSELLENNTELIRRNLLHFSKLKVAPKTPKQNTV